jgi:cytosine/uracil/thiamine/allantoin permease
MAKSSILHNFRDGLIAVLAGNAVYFLLMPHLPARLQHEPFKQDLGLVVDFAICFALFVLVRRFMRSPQ